MALFDFLKPAHDDILDNLFEEDVSILKRYIGSDAFIHAHIYQKLVEILDAVFDGYQNGTFTFLPVDEDLDDDYQQLRRQLKNIESKLKIHNLRIMDFKPIPTLNGHFQYYIGLWNFGKVMYHQDQERLLRVAENDILPDKLQLMFITIDRYLQEHKNNKLKLLGGELDPNIVSYAGIQFDTSKATLKYKDSEWYTVQVNQKEMQFLRMLVDAKGRVIEYDMIARSLDLNAAHQQADTKELARTVQFLKRDLSKRLKQAGMNNDTITQILDSIVSIHGMGYKLIHLR